MTRGCLLLAALAAGLLLAAPGRDARAEGESLRRSASVGYVYPAGGTRGTVVHAIVGGQNLRGVSAVSVSGGGVAVAVVRHVPPLSPQQQGELRRQLAEIEQARRGTLRDIPGRKADDDRVALPDHPMLNDLASKTPRELKDVAVRFLGAGARRQQNVQIAEQVEVDVTIDATAAPGERELRLLTPAGLTNPLRFEVGTLPEAAESEPVSGDVAETPPVAVPFVLDGQILPGDVDRVRLRAKRGQHLVVDVAARRLVPYLADAVPGWFQATAALYDGRGAEVAFADDWRFEPDPVFLFDVPADGEYVLEIRDALWRGREDFVYRATVAEEPFVTRVFPLGGAEGAPLTAEVGGWNLPGPAVAFDTRPGGDAVRWATVRRGDVPSNPFPYAVGTLPECAEAEPNDDAAHAQSLAPPLVVNGRIGRAGDVDLFTFEGRAGDDVVAEVTARRLWSPLDSSLTLSDAEGRTVAWNDDSDDPCAGLLTHQADSYLRARLPSDGTYRVQVADAERHGGPEFAYRLRVGAPQPDFEVLVTPSSLATAAGRCVPFTVHAVRRDGFDGPIDVVAVGAPEGVAISGATIPAGASSVRMTLSVRDPLAAPVALRLEARFHAGEIEVRRRVVPADDRMQAFAYRHLVPAQDLVVATLGPRRAGPWFERTDAASVRIPAGGTAEVRLAAGRAAGADVTLDDPPPGVTLERATVDRGSLVLVLRADASAKPGTSGNLIAEAAPALPPAVRDRPGAARAARAAASWLPAIPFEIVAR